jgi:hypothetical protein
MKAITERLAEARREAVAVLGLTGAQLVRTCLRATARVATPNFREYMRAAGVDVDRLRA